ncbi:hypothetical protein [Arthrobacter mobilis]|uniref:Uncharacterized protein n=1 Tax=Arthrobacter mobilis TaxID=2724944 RepID=A0A7X6HE38_9MICC|nr:hypothetical protein [Arthrobacter mobilis]NKX55361.1 hypothetical protein [Arthrobacter mobilis]
MTDLAVTLDVHKQIRQWQQEAGLPVVDLQQPRRSWAAMLTILLDARSADARTAALSISSILTGSTQRNPLQVLIPDSEDSVLLEQWLAFEPDVRFVRTVDEAVLGAQYLLVCPAGVVFGSHSVQAAVEAAQESGARLLRAVVDGVSGSLELWDTAGLGSAADLSAAEQGIRDDGGERWVSGASLGAYAAGRPAPKMFLRKGAAGRFDVHVVVKDLKDPAARRDYEQQIRQLESELARAKRHWWQEASSAAPAGGTARRPFGSVPLRAVRKGPRYLAARTALRLRRWTTG